MAEYHLSNKAVEDLNGIWDYTFDNWSEEQADKYYNMLLGFCQDIARIIHESICIRYLNILISNDLSHITTQLKFGC